MPPSPLYNWLCVLYSASEIISHAATIRAGQIARANRELGRGFERPGVVGGRTLVEERYVKGRRVDGKEPAAEKRETPPPLKADLESENQFRRRELTEPPISPLQEHSGSDSLAALSPATAQEDLTNVLVSSATVDGIPGDVTVPLRSAAPKEPRHAGTRKAAEEVGAIETSGNTELDQPLEADAKVNGFRSLILSISLSSASPIRLATKTIPTSVANPTKSPSIPCSFFKNWETVSLWRPCSQSWLRRCFGST